MRALQFSVLISNTDGQPTSRCSFLAEDAARKKYVTAVTSAECACSNIGHVSLARISFPNAGVMEEWVREPEESDMQVAGYIVHSARSLNGMATSCRSVNKTFHKTEHEALQAARKLADKWKLGHEGLIVFKAIQHVKKIARKVTPTTKIRVFGV